MKRKRKVQWNLDCGLVDRAVRLYPRSQPAGQNIASSCHRFSCSSYTMNMHASASTPPKSSSSASHQTRNTPQRESPHPNAQNQTHKIIFISRDKKMEEKCIYLTLHTPSKALLQQTSITHECSVQTTRHHSRDAPQTSHQRL